MKILLQFFLLFENYNPTIITLYLKKYRKLFVFSKWGNVDWFRTGRSVTSHTHFQITTCFNFHWNRVVSCPDTGTIILSFYINGIESHANKCNTNVILHGLDSIQMLWQKQCCTKYRHIQTSEAWKHLFWSH